MFILSIGFTSVHAEELNGVETSWEEETNLSEDYDSNALSIWIEDDYGNVVTEVDLSDPWSPSTNAYWVRWDLGGTYVYDMTVRLVFRKLGNNPTKRINIKYDFGSSGYAARGSTPFTISLWGGTTVPGRGRAILITPVGKVATSFTIVR